MNLHPKYTVEFLLSHTRQEGTCRVWTLGCGHNGYGHISRKKGGNGKTVGNYGTHRVMWYLVNGEIPKGLCVLHRCDNPPCINVDHLFLGTHGDNAADRNTKGRSGGASPGSKHHKAKLDEQEVRWIRRILATKKLPQTSIAKMFNIPQSVVSEINTGKAWATA